MADLTKKKLSLAEWKKLGEKLLKQNKQRQAKWRKKQKEKKCSEKKKNHL